MRFIIAFFITVSCFSPLLPQRSADAADIIVKYYIFSMDTQEDEKKVVDYIMKHDGVTKVETILDRHWVYVSYEDEVLNDERFQLRLRLGDELGYKVDRWEVLWEHTEGHE
ncbi:MAG TPA: hypothetical protein EYG88_13315 [Desulfocapsa sulfexigens]|nr:hypothetical protein [Desulfocapsa sulfexigens]